MKRALLGTVFVFVLLLAASPAAGEHTLPSGCAVSPVATTYEGMRDRRIYLMGEDLAGFNMIKPSDSFFGTPRVEQGSRSNRTVAGTPYIPPVLLKAIGYVESGLAQADHSVFWGATGPTKVSFDCGHGIMQITSGMTSPLDGGSPSTQQSLITTHYLYNIARGAAILVEKWNTAPEARPVVGNSNPRIIEDWYYAIWGYNGFAGVNNPLRYTWPRTPYSCGPSNDGFSHDRSNHPYQELVFGCASRPPSVDSQRLWSPQAVSLPNLNDARWRDPLSRFPNSSQMDMPSPSPTHQDPTPRPGDSLAPFLLGSPSLRVTPTSVNGVTNQVTISNTGSGILSWRAKPEQSWLRVSRKAGVALAPSVPCTSGQPCARNVTLTITVDLSRAPLTGQGRVFIDSLTNGQRRTVWVYRDYRSDGSLLKGSGNSVYVMRDGLRRHIPDPQTLEARGYDWPAILRLPDSTLNALPMGQPLLSVLDDGNLLRGSGTTVYVMDGGRKRHVASPSVMSACGYNFNSVYAISSGALGGVPTGARLNGPPCPRFSPPTGALLKGSANTVYAMSRGLKRRTPNPVTLEAKGYLWGNINDLPDASLASIPTGAPLLDALAKGNLLRGSGTTVYVMDGGRKRHVASPGVMSACGYGFDAVRTISNGRLAGIPTGTRLNGPPCPVFSPPTGTLLKGGGTTVYVMDGGRKRRVTSPSVFVGCGYLWGNINGVASSTLSSIPSGAALTGSPCP